MKSKKSQSRRARSRWPLQMLVTAMVIVVTLVATAPTVRAINLTDRASSLIEELKNNSVIKDVMTEYQRLSRSWLPQVRRIVGVSDQDWAALTGAIGLLAPSEAKATLEERESTQKTVPGTGKSAAFGAEVAANQELSKEAQESSKEELNDISDLADAAEEMAWDVQDLATTAQEDESSQDVLKRIADQNGLQAVLIASQIRINALQNKNMQGVKAQLAVANQSSASLQKAQLSKTQQELLQQEQQALATMMNLYRSYNH